MLDHNEKQLALIDDRVIHRSSKHQHQYIVRIDDLQYFTVSLFNKILQIVNTYDILMLMFTTTVYRTY